MSAKRISGLFVLVASVLVCACTAPAATEVPFEVEEWTAEWIGAPWDGEEFNPELVQPAPEFMTSFNASKRIRSAVASVTGLGFFEFYVNGIKCGEDVLSPNETSYGHRETLWDHAISMDDSNWRGFRVFYLSYDITKLLRRGDNVISALVGNGFYAIKAGWVDPYGTPRFLCQVDVTYEDGTTERVSTDENWKVRRSPIVMNDMYKGEIYDARLEDADEWQPAVHRKAPDGRLMLQDGVPDRVVRTIEPSSVRQLEDGSWELLFDEYVTGWIRLCNFQAPEGTEIEIDFPIEVDGNGVYKYISNGQKVTSYAPRFCWWAYDRAVIKGWPGILRPSNFVAEVVNSDVRENAHFECSNTLFNRICEIWKQSMLDNMHLGVETDCPHREKGPYTGDGEASCVAVLHNFDVSAFYRKWFHDMSDCQDLVTGYVPNGAPWHPGCGGGVPWGAAMNIMPWEYYVRYGDLAVLEENYVPMKEQVRYMLSWRLDDGTMLQEKTRIDGSVCYWMNLGDWCPPYSLPSGNLVHTWYLWRCASYTAKAANALGYKEDAETYQRLADDVAAAFHAKFYNPVTGSYGDVGPRKGTGYGVGDHEGCGDGSNIFALAMGVPEDRYDRVMASVRAELEANGGHFNTGIYASSLFFEVLCGNGMAEEAFEAMNKTDYPGFGDWIGQGAKTMWEQWNGEASRVHHMFGGALSWLYRNLCGVQTDESEPAYRHVILKPAPCGDISWAEYSTETPNGLLSVRWDRSEDGSFVYRMTIPEGSHATVFMPDGSGPQAVPSGRTTLRCLCR